MATLLRRLCALSLSVCFIYNPIKKHNLILLFFYVFLYVVASQCGVWFFVMYDKKDILCVCDVFEPLLWSYTVYIA